jgi:hypothetical protein
VLGVPGERERIHCSISGGVRSQRGLDMIVWVGAGDFSNAEN